MPLSPRVFALVELLEPFVCDVGIYLGRGDVRVAEHGLDYPEIRPPLQQVRGERMAHYVGLCPAPVYAGYKGVLLHYLPEVLAGHPGAPDRQEQGRIVPALQEPRPCLVHVPLEPVHGSLAQGDHPLLRALAKGRQIAALEAEIVHLQAYKLRDTQASCVQCFQHGLVTKAERRISARGAKEPVNLFKREELRQLPVKPGYVDIGARRGLDDALSQQELVEAPERYKGPCVGPHREAERAEGLKKGAYIIRPGLFRRASRSGEEFLELLKVPRVREAGIGREPPFDHDVVEKVPEEA